MTLHSVDFLFSISTINDMNSDDDDDTNDLIKMFIVLVLMQGSASS